MTATGAFRTGGVAAAIAATALSACHPVRRSESHVDLLGGGRPMRAVDRLDCPATQGRLTRASASPDGRACQYAGADGETVNLTILALNGHTPQAALASIETELKGGGTTPSAAPGASAESGATVTSVDTAMAGDSTGRSADSNTTGRTSGEHADIDLPFLHIHSDGDKADVKLPGVDVHADGDDAHVKTGWGAKSTSINARGGHAEIRVGDVGRTNANLMYILADDRAAADGYKAKGYIARGPANGPLVVAVFKARDKRSDRHGTHDLERLIDRNVRG